MSKIISLVNQKGGTGKTTSTINIACGLKNRGYKVLLIDLDAQGNATTCLGVEAENLKTTYELLTNDNVKAKDVIIKKKIDVIPSDIRLAGAEAELMGKPYSGMILKEKLEEVKDSYDFVFIDCSPSLGILTLNALSCSNEVYIPVQAEILPLKGLTQLIDTIKVIQRRANPGLKINGVIVTMYDNRKTLNKDILAKLNGYFNDKVFKTYIRNNIALAEAPGSGLDIYDYAPGSNGATDYNNLIDEIIERELKA